MRAFAACSSASSAARIAALLSTSATSRAASSETTARRRPARSRRAVSVSSSSSWRGAGGAPLREVGARRGEQRGGLVVSLARDGKRRLEGAEIVALRRRFGRRRGAFELGGEALAFGLGRPPHLVEQRATLRDQSATARQPVAEVPRSERAAGASLAFTHSRANDSSSARRACSVRASRCRARPCGRPRVDRLALFGETLVERHRSRR